MNQIWENSEKPNFELNFSPFGPIMGPKRNLSLVLPLPDVSHCHMLSSYSISRKRYNLNQRKFLKTSFCVWFRPVGPTFGPLIFVYKTSS